MVTVAPAMGEIIMAVHKPNPRLLTAQLASIRNQTVTSWSCRVGIDGRDDATLALLQGLLSDDDRFRIQVYRENVGVYRHFERMLGTVDHECAWIALADQDDRWHADKLERLTTALSGKWLVTGQANIVDEAGQSLGGTNRRLLPTFELLLDNQITGSLSVFLPELLVKALPFPTPTPAAYHDHWLGAVASCKAGISVIPDIVQDYVQHGRNVLGEQRAAERHMYVLRHLASPRFVHILHQLRSERWAWRVEMARTINARFPFMDSDVQDMACDQLTPHSGLRIARAVARRDIDRPRGLALVVGALPSFRRRRHPR